MADVKKRSYDSSRRQAQAARTRRDIIDAAGELFAASGYAGTTMTDIAEAANVAVETIYRGFDGKAGLLEQVILAAVVGGSERLETPRSQRRLRREIFDEPDARKKIAMGTAMFPGIFERSGPLLRALHEAAASDPELRTVWDRIEQDRLASLLEVGRNLVATEQVRTDLTAEEFADVTWTLTSLAVHDLFVLERGWSPQQFADWLNDTSQRQFLPGSAAGEAPGMT